MLKHVSNYYPITYAKKKKMQMYCYVLDFDPAIPADALAQKRRLVRLNEDKVGWLVDWLVMKRCACTGCVLFVCSAEGAAGRVSHHRTG